MEEKILVPLETDLTAILRTDDFSRLRLADVPRDNLAAALQYIANVMHTVQEKYSELEELSRILETG